MPRQALEPFHPLTTLPNLRSFWHWAHVLLLLGGITARLRGVTSLQVGVVLMAVLSTANYRLFCLETDLFTPYFLPETSLIAALRLAALRGLEVDILIPAKNNLRFVQWASTAQLWQFLDAGCRIWLTPRPPQWRLRRG